MNLFFLINLFLSLFFKWSSIWRSTHMSRWPVERITARSYVIFERVLMNKVTIGNSWQQNYSVIITVSNFDPKILVYDHWICWRANDPVRIAIGTLHWIGYVLIECSLWGRKTNPECSRLTIGRQCFWGFCI